MFHLLIIRGNCECMHALVRACMRAYMRACVHATADVDVRKQLSGISFLSPPCFEAVSLAVSAVLHTSGSLACRLLGILLFLPPISAVSVGDYEMPTSHPLRKTTVAASPLGSTTSSAMDF